MITTEELNERELLEQFENSSLNPILFTHEIQLRISWIYIQKYDVEKATDTFSKFKEHYYINVLKSNKFNLPLTKAYVEILHYFMEKSSVTDFDKLLREFPRLKFNFKKLVKTHYGYDILKEHRTEDPQPVRPILFTF